MVCPGPQCLPQGSFHHPESHRCSLLGPRVCLQNLQEPGILSNLPVPSPVTPPATRLQVSPEGSATHSQPGLRGLADLSRPSSLLVFQEELKGGESQSRVWGFQILTCSSQALLLFQFPWLVFQGSVLRVTWVPIPTSFVLICGWYKSPLFFSSVCLGLFQALGILQ